MSKLEPIVEEDRQSIDKSSLSEHDPSVGESGEPLVPKKRVTIADNCTNGAGNLSTTVGEGLFVLLFSYLFLGRLPKVDLIILEGGGNVRPSVHKKFLRFQ